MSLIESASTFSKWVALIGCSRAGMVYTRDGIELRAYWDEINRLPNRRFVLFVSWESWTGKTEQELGEKFVERSRVAGHIHDANQERRRITAAPIERVLNLRPCSLIEYRHTLGDNLWHISYHFLKGGGDASNRTA